MISRIERDSDYASNVALAAKINELIKAVNWLVACAEYEDEQSRRRRDEA